MKITGILGYSLPLSSLPPVIFEEHHSLPLSSLPPVIQRRGVNPNEGSSPNSTPGNMGMFPLLLSSLRRGETPTKDLTSIGVPGNIFRKDLKK